MKASPLLGVPVLLLLACGGEPPPPPEAPAAVAKAAEKPTIDLSPVSEPRSLVVLARIARPQATIQTVADWMHAPVPPGGVVSDAIVDMDVGDIIDLRYPVDVALTVEGSTRSPRIAWAVSAPLLPGESTNAKLRDHFVLTPGAGGVVRMDLKKEEEDDTDRRCAIYPAFGPAATRIVCGESETAVRDLAPYLTRTRTRADAGKDVELEARAAPVRGLLTEGRQLFPALATSFIGARGMPGLSTLITEVVGDVVDFATDLDRIALDATLGSGGADANVKISFVGSTSLLGRLITSSPDKAGPPPEAFIKLPADSEGAFFGRGWDDRELARPKEVLFQFARAVLEKEGIGAGDAQSLERALSGYLSLGSSGWVSASGSDWASAAAAVKKLSAARTGKKLEPLLDAEKTAVEKLNGWSVWGVELPLAKVQATAQDLVTAYNRPAVQKALKPQLKDGVPLPVLKTVPVSAALKLPKDTIHVELSVTRLVDEEAAFADAAAPAAAPVASRDGTLSGPVAKIAPKKTAAAKAKAKLAKPIKVHGFIVPDGSRTWIAWGMDETLVAGKIRGILAGDGPTLATRPGLDGLRAAKLNGGGFFDARNFAKPDAAGLIGLLHSAGAAQLPSEDKLPSGDWGKTPMWLGVRTEGTGDRRATTVSVRVPREAISDLGSGQITLGRRHGRRL